MVPVLCFTVLFQLLITYEIALSSLTIEEKHCDSKTKAKTKTKAKIKTKTKTTAKKNRNALSNEV